MTQPHHRSNNVFRPWLALCLFLTVPMLLSGAGKPTLAQLDQVFNLNSVARITIRITPDQWNKLLHNIDRNRATRRYVRADFEFEQNGNKQTLAAVGFRIRGGGFSRIRPELGANHNPQAPQWKQAHFKVDFRRFRKKRRFHGLKEINLKMFKGDPAYVREIYCLDLYRRFGISTAHRSSYTELYIHVKGDGKPACFGIYRMNEPVDSVFLDRRFPGRTQDFLWKCTWPADLRLATVQRGKGRIGVRKKSATRLHPFHYDLKIRKKKLAAARAQLLDFMKQLNTLQGKALERWLQQNVAVRSFLKTLAVTVLVGHWDAYWGNKNNYYAWFDNKGRFHFIPYDADNTLGTCGGMDTGTADIWHWGRGGASRPLVTKILSVARYRKLYARYLRQLLDPGKKLFHPSASIPRVKRWQKLVADRVDNDTGQRSRLQDRPAGWGSCSWYRLTSGDGAEDRKEVNYFKLRTATALRQLKRDYKTVRYQRKPVPPTKDKPLPPHKSGHKRRFARIYLRGYFNNWGITPMQLVADYTWRTTFTCGKLRKYDFKFASGPNWGRDKDWGETSKTNDGKAEPDSGSGKNITCPGPGRYQVTFNTSTLRYTLKKL